MTTAASPLDDMTKLDHGQAVFVLTTPTPVDISSVLADRSRFGPAIRCFLSPFDALLEMVFLRRQNSDAVEAVLQSSRVPAGIFFSNRFRQRPLTVHVAWLAHENRLVVQQNGRPIRTARDQAAQWRIGPRRDAEMAIEAETWAVLDRLHERAGLFAWRETLQTTRRWLASPAVEESALRRAITALEAVDLIVLPAGKAGQFALYDPEAGCWHFVPRDTIT